ncbi:SpoIIE family protein phosphatase [Cellulomonas sp. DKR-3]|uniref:SpoIIE family protein phosphatase n=1 Tax=Cellulomonas fulva TaxID=2835530 RepID=A0ABS5U0Q6_9CELL|nr:SpoIIE family protein phosphatase [Cellulomonas fulva]MBT0994984.1 SpoIIE family protein phosphatase [Cellulomonas fulva]
MGTRGAETGEASPGVARTSADVTALSLQRALLPSSVPLLQDVDLAAAYRVAGDEQSAGGDWFDASLAPDGRLWLSVGDVVGHGIEAAAAMCQMRAIFAARSLDGATLGEALASLDRYSHVAAGTFATTVCTAVLDPATGELEYVTRGHPAPLVVGPRGARLLPSTQGDPIGLGGDRVGRATLAADEAILLFTDGAVERPGRPLDAGLRALQDAVVAAHRDEAAPGGTAERVCRRVVGAAGGTARDDATALCAARREPFPDLELVIPADPGRLGQVRQAVGGWLERLGLPAQERTLLVLAASEAAANSIEHGYQGGGTGDVTVTARVRGVTIHLEVRDEGRWRRPTRDPGDRGRGLAMIASGGARLSVTSGASGTRTRVDVDARRSVPVGGPAIPVALPGDGTVDAADGIVRIRGSFDDEATVAALEHALRRQSRGASSPVTVDIDPSTFLGSGAVRALARAAREGAAGGGAVDIVVPRSTSAALTLELSRTPTTET